MTNEAALEKQQAAELAKKAREWIATNHGKQAVERVVAEARQAQDQLQKARHVDLESLNQPVTL